MATNSFSALPIQIQRVVMSGLDSELDDLRDRVRVEEMGSAPDREKIAWYQKDMDRVESLRQRFLNA